MNRDTLTTSRAAFARVLAGPCPRHTRPAGVPCWHVIASTGPDRPGLCGERITRAGFAPVAPSKWDTDPRKGRAGGRT